MTETDGALKALAQALKLEEEGLQFYLRAADEVVDERCEETLRSLADDERKHIDMIQRQVEALEDQGRYVRIPDIEVESIDLNKRIFPPTREAVLERVDVDSNLLHVLHVAPDNEMRSYDLYRQAARETDDEAAAEMYT